MINVSDRLKAQVEREYQDGFNHVRSWRDEVRAMMESSLNDKAPEGKVKIDLVKENAEFELATFMDDSMEVRFVSDEGVIGKEITDNAQKVAKYDYQDMDLELLKEQIIFENVYKGIAVTVTDIWDKFENQPVCSSIDPLTVIPDPKCHNGSYMRYVGFERRLSEWTIKNNGSFDIKGVDITNIEDSKVLKDADRAKSSDYNTLVSSNSGLVPVYDHMTIYEGKKILTTWINERSICIRMEELDPLSESEKVASNKIIFPVQFHRRKPKMGRWAGYSVLEEVQNTEDIVTQLKNLEVTMARIAAYGPDTLIGDQLGLDTAELQKSTAGGRIIPVTSVGGAISQHIQTLQPSNPNQYSIQTAQGLIDRSKRNTGYTDISMGVSPGGQQTKAEIQTLQQSANKILSMVSSNYMRGMRDFWKSWYRAYSVYMSPKAKKTIALFDSGGISQTLKKNEFISEGKVIIEIKSEQQEAIQDEKNVTKLMALSNLVIGNLKPGYSLNRFLRTIIDKSSIKGVKGENIIPYTIDEMRAIRNSKLLMRNIELKGKPMPGEDLEAYIQIYSELPQNEARDKALDLYKNAKIQKDLLTRSQEQQAPQQDAQGGAMAMNMLSQQQQGQPALSM